MNKSNLPADLLGERRPFLQDGMTIVVEFYDEEAERDPSQKVTCKVVETEPVVKGQTAAIALNQRSWTTVSRLWCHPLSHRT